LKTIGLTKNNAGPKDSNEDGEVVPVKPEVNGTTPILITDVRQFRSMLQVSAGPQPVKNISFFEELDAKL